MLQLCQADPDHFFDPLATMNELSVAHYDPQTKKCRKQWKNTDSSLTTAKKGEGVTIIGETDVERLFRLP